MGGIFNRLFKNYNPIFNSGQHNLRGIHYKRMDGNQYRGKHINKKLYHFYYLCKYRTRIN